MTKRRVLVPLPRTGFDPTEAGVPFVALREAGHDVVIATPDGARPEVDRRMYEGTGLGLLRRALRADANGRRAFDALAAAPAFERPIPYEAMRASDYDALLLPGGHDKGMRDYLGSPLVHAVIADHFDAEKPVAAICHGTLAAGRAVSKRTGRSVLYGRKTTGLLRAQELVAWNLTRAWLGDYYRTYPELDRPGHVVTMADELIGYLERPSDFVRGPGWPIPSKRDAPDELGPGFTHRDGNYLSARWPGDAHRFARDLLALLG